MPPGIQLCDTVSLQKKDGYSVWNGDVQSYVSPGYKIYPSLCGAQVQDFFSESELSYLQSFPASGSCLMSQLFTTSGQKIGASASASILPITAYDTAFIVHCPCHGGRSTKNHG